MRKSGVFRCKIKRSFLKIFIIPLFLVITLTLVYSFSPLVFAWVGPTEAPPGTSLDLGECFNYLDFGCSTCFPEDIPISWHECAVKKIGDYCGGGKVAHLNGSGGGLIAASADNSPGVRWGYDWDPVGAYGAYIGTGASNTSKILSAYTTRPIAASICGDLFSEGYGDWYLPSRWELAQLYAHRIEIGGFQGDFYWSSTEIDRTYAWYQHFGTGNQENLHNKSNLRRVRCIRTF